MKRAILSIPVFLLVAAVTVFAAGYTRVLGPQIPAASTAYTSSWFTPGDSVKAVFIVTGGTVCGSLSLQGQYSGVTRDTVQLFMLTGTTGTNTMRYTGLFSPDSLRKLGLPPLDSNSVARNYILGDTENFRYRWVWKEFATGIHTGTATLTEIK